MKILKMYFDQRIKEFKFSNFKIYFCNYTKLLDFQKLSIKFHINNLSIAVIILSWSWYM